jgi:hypothetical protein
MWGLADLLRCGVMVQDAHGPAWWGYVSGVEIHAGARVARVSLDALGSRVSVRYRPLSPTGYSGADQYTGWHTDAESARVYGIKERMFFLPQAGEDEASAYAAAMLKKVGKPQFTPGVDRAAGTEDAASAEDAAGEQPYALLECRGWWETLDWRFYKEERGLIENIRPGADQKFGDTTLVGVGAIFPAQPESWLLSEVWVRMRKFGAPTDGVRLELRLNQSGFPASTALATCAVGHASVPDNWDWVRFAFSTPVALSNTQIHWLILWRTGATNASHHYMVSADQGANYPGGHLLVYTTSWAQRSPAADLTFHLSGVEETTAQIRRMLSASAGGQFLSSARVEIDSGIYGRLYRGGSRRARVEVEELLHLGSTGGRRLLATVTPERVARIYPQPLDTELAASPGAGLQIGPGGHIQRADGQPLALSTAAAGCWARLGTLTPPGSPAGYSGRVFIETALWERGELRVG